MEPQIERRLVLAPYVTRLTDCDATEQKVSCLCVGGGGRQKTAFTRLKLMFEVPLLAANSPSKKNCCWSDRLTSYGHMLRRFDTVSGKR